MTISESVKALQETVETQNTIIIKMAVKVDLMWKAFLGVCAFSGLAILGRVFDVI